MADGSNKMLFMTKAEYIYSTLKDDIVTGVLKSGERLILSKIAEQFSASEVPVREAIKKLEVEGLINNVPYVGAVVKTLNIREVKDLYQIRANVEGLAIKMALENADGAGLARIEKIIADMENAMNASDVVEFGRTDKKFHLEIALLSGNRRLHKLIESLWNETEQAQFVFRVDPKLMSESFREHMDIYNTIKTKDPIKAEEMVKYHRLRIADKVLELLMTSDGAQES